MNLVVGSGPAGVACAKGLLARGLPVTIVDAGLELEPALRARADRLASVSPSAWTAGDVERWGEDEPAGAVPLKRVHGSDFYRRAPAEAPRLEQSGTVALRSYARGGLSRAWGATFVPFTEEEFSRWPVSFRDLAPHYAEVLRWVPWAAAPDGLDGVFPDVGPRSGALDMSPQGEGYRRHLEERREALEKDGCRFGRARLAVSRKGNRGCMYCARCLEGCPYGSIYSSTHTLAELALAKGFAYKPGVLVRRLRESAREVRLEALEVGTGRPLELAAERVFLAGGALPTTQILMESLDLPETKLLTSQAFWVPLLGPAGATSEPAHALSQIYLLWEKTPMARRAVQFQIYTASGAIAEGLDGSLPGKLLRLLPPLRRAVLSRLSVLQGLLHSDDSDPLTLTALRKRDGISFLLQGRLSEETRGRIAGAAAFLGERRELLGGRPLGAFTRVSAPGQSFHTGASFPMAARPGPNQSDLLGRPVGLTRVHAVDAAVLPALPAPPPTFTLMANAHRIATHA